MATASQTRKLTILAQDPSIRVNGTCAFAQVDNPAEVLSSGPTGYCVKVVDFDASANVLYAPRHYLPDPASQDDDPYVPKEGQPLAARKRWEAKVLADPAVHAQHCYAIIMRTLAHFEFALGRRVSWGFSGHRMHVAPHAFQDGNAFYLEHDRALVFGYFPSARTSETVFTCLSYEIVAHETTHAVLDGIRNGFTYPSMPDQAAFHQGFADVVVRLSVFSFKEIVAAPLQGTSPLPPPRKNVPLISKARVTRKVIESSIPLGLGEQFGAHLAGARANALRRSISLKPDRTLLAQDRFQEEHDRGEVLVAAVLHSFLTMWTSRIEGLGTFKGDMYNLDRVIEEGSKAADHLLTMSIRALDYCPPVDLSFGDFLAALLTADSETVPDDSQHHYREIIRKSFRAYGIDSSGGVIDRKTGNWAEFQPEAEISYGRTHVESMLHDKEEVFRSIWENRHALKLNELRLDEKSYMRVGPSDRACAKARTDFSFARPSASMSRRCASLAPR
ncbi:MAG: hypothetical protein ACK4PH_01720 [Aquincola tertiaricarbonis]